MKNFLLFWIFLFISFSSSAQLYLGGKLGGNYSNINGIHENSEGRFGVQLGAVTFFSLNKNKSLFLQTEINYSQQGEYDRVIDDYGNSHKQKILWII